MIYVILAKWGDSKNEELLIQHPRQDECFKYYQGLVKDAKKRKLNVTYRMTELEGNLQYTQEEIDEINKRSNLTGMTEKQGKIIT